MNELTAERAAELWAKQLRRVNRARALGEDDRARALDDEAHGMMTVYGLLWDRVSCGYNSCLNEYTKVQVDDVKLYV